MAAESKRKKEIRKFKTRNWHAVNAKFRNTAGAIKDKKKEKDKKACRSKPVKE